MIVTQFVRINIESLAPLAEQITTLHFAYFLHQRGLVVDVCGKQLNQVKGLLNC
jgi:hypothetical protein